MTKMRKLQYMTMFSDEVLRDLRATDPKSDPAILAGHYCSKNYDWQLVRSEYRHDFCAWQLIFEAEITEEQYIWEQLGGKWPKNQ